ncbi:MAG: hypothetical protein JO332_05985, partial [Planctomycetaceae bacterium]|nr:hypothetical protein [Planctomycetaceae bacterium]
MGHEISYCHRCAIRVGSADIEKGGGFRVDGKLVCAACATPEEKQAALPPAPTSRAQSTTRVRAQKPGLGTSTKLPTARSEPRPVSKAPLYLGLGVGSLLLVGGAAWMMSGSPRETPPIVVRPPDPPPRPLPPRDPDPPKEDSQLRDAREALAAARAKAAATPNDLEAQRGVWEEAARRTALTPFFKEASAELQAVKDKLAALKPPEPVKVVEKPVVPPPPPDPKPTVEVAVSPALWTAAMEKATAGDFDGAAAELRKEAAGRREADDLLQAQAALLESRKEISRLPAGQPVGLTYRSDLGDRKRIEGTVLRAGPHRLELKVGEETAFVEIGDVSAGTLAEICKPSEVLKRRYALLCLLEGDREAAERLVGADAFPPRTWDYARDAAPKVPKVPVRELEARRLFYAAERDFAKPETLADAASKYRTLGENYADTAVVKSESVRVKTRAEAGKDYLLTAFQLKGASGFGLAAAPRGEAGWTSKADVDGAQAVTNYVAAEFSALPGTTYRCWALIGACCAETFTFYLQTTDGTDLNPKTRQKESIEPGAGMASLVKHTLKDLARSHRSHVVKVPKSPVRWEWIAIPLPRHPAPGPKKIHLISDQQGFSVGAIVVSATRTAPPADAELKEEAARAKASVAAQGLSLENPGEKAWRALFDGKTKESILRGNAPGWKVEDGKLFRIREINDAAQSREDFGDVEL